jgi:hypothetical protein
MSRQIQNTENISVVPKIASLRSMSYSLELALEEPKSYKKPEHDYNHEWCII